MSKNRLVILIPVYEDWASLRLLLSRLDECLESLDYDPAIMIVDDASCSPYPGDLVCLFRAITHVRVLRLRANLGHQRAIAVGLCYIQVSFPCDKIIIMDADGEDRPEDIPRLLERSATEGERRVIFAERAERSESWLFRVFYWVYRFVFYIATGRSIQFGNFSLIPYSLLGRTVALPELWNNYAAAIVKARIPFLMVACNRGHRLVGKSKMSLVGLILHGLSAISVYSDVFGARALMASLGVMALALLLAITATVIRLATDLAIPGWATYAVGLSLLAVLQAVTLTAFFVFLILHGRNSTTFVPGRDYEYFIEDALALFETETKPA